MAGRRSWGTIVLSRERTERSRTIPSFRKKNERIERDIKNIGTICKGTRTRTERLKKKERERNDLSEGPRSRTEQNDFKKVGTCPALHLVCILCNSIDIYHYPM